MISSTICSGDSDRGLSRRPHTHHRPTERQRPPSEGACPCPGLHHIQKTTARRPFVNGRNCASNLLEGVRSVRIVDKHPKILATLHGFESPRKPEPCLPAPSRMAAADTPSAQAAPAAASAFENVVPPHHAHIDRKHEPALFISRLTHKAETRSLRHQAGLSSLGCARPQQTQSEPQRLLCAPPSIGDKSSSAFSTAVRLISESVEEARLRISVRRHVSVIVQMVLAQVREHTDVKVHTMHAMLHESMRAHLHHRSGQVLIDHFSQEPVHFNGVRSRVDESLVTAIDPRPQRADHSVAQGRPS